MVDFTSVVILVTTPNISEAELIAKAVLEARKAASVNIIPLVSSYFWWEDKINSSEESLLVIKTRVELTDEVIRVVKKFHSYKVPQVIALPIISGNYDYLEWLRKETGSK